MNLEIRRQQTGTRFTLRADEIIQDATSAFAPLNFCSTATDASPAYAVPPSLVPYTNRPYERRRTWTKRPTGRLTAHVCVPAPTSRIIRKPDGNITYIYCRPIPGGRLPGLLTSIRPILHATQRFVYEVVSAPLESTRNASDIQ